MICLEEIDVCDEEILISSFRLEQVSLNFVRKLNKTDFNHKMGISIWDEEMFVMKRCL